MGDDIGSWFDSEDDDGWNRDDDNANEAGVEDGLEFFRSTRDENR